GNCHGRGARLRGEIRVPCVHPAKMAYLFLYCNSFATASGSGSNARPEVGSARRRDYRRRDRPLWAPGAIPSDHHRPWWHLSGGKACGALQGDRTGSDIRTGACTRHGTVRLSDSDLVKEASAFVAKIASGPTRAHAAQDKG